MNGMEGTEKLAYDYMGMFRGLLADFPSLENIVRAEIEWCRQVLRKLDRIVWWLRQMRTYWYHTASFPKGNIHSLVEWNNAQPPAVRLSAQALENMSQELGKKYTALFRQDVHRLGLEDNPIAADALGARHGGEQAAFSHYLSLPIPEIQAFTWGHQTPSELNATFQGIENKWKEETRGMILPRPEDKAVLAFPDGWAWWILDRAYCDEESRAMGHCGNRAAGPNRPWERILSLRRLIKRGKQEYWEPHLTFILDTRDKSLGEMKGRGNEKPAPQYHPYIVALLERPDLVRKIKGGGYSPEANFSLSDLPDEQQGRVRMANPYTAGYVTFEEDRDRNILEFPDGMQWVMSPVNPVNQRDDNGPDDRRILSLRKPSIVKDGVQFWEELLSGRYDAGTRTLTSLQTKWNTKPEPTYHPYIAALLKDELIGFLAPGREKASHAHFTLGDLPEDMRNDVVQVNPYLAGYVTIKPEEEVFLQFQNGWVWKANPFIAAKNYGPLNESGAPNGDASLRLLEPTMKKGEVQFWKEHLSAEYSASDRSVRDITQHEKGKPDPMYHPYITALFDADKVDEIRKTRNDGYFQFSDLPMPVMEGLVEKYPSVATYTFRLQKFQSQNESPNKQFIASLASAVGASVSEWRPKLRGFAVESWKGRDDFIEKYGDDTAKYVAKQLEGGGDTYDPEPYDTEDNMREVLDECSPETLALVMRNLVFNHGEEMLGWLEENGDEGEEAGKVDAHNPMAVRKFLKKTSLDTKDLARFIDEADPGEAKGDLLTAWSDAVRMGAEEEMYKALKGAIDDLMGTPDSPTAWGTWFHRDDDRDWDAVIEEIFPVERAASIADTGDDNGDDINIEDYCESMGRSEEPIEVKVNEPYSGWNGWSGTACDELVRERFYFREDPEERKKKKPRKRLPKGAVLPEGLHYEHRTLPDGSAYVDVKNAHNIPIGAGATEREALQDVLATLAEVEKQKQKQGSGMGFEKVAYDYMEMFQWLLQLMPYPAFKDRVEEDINWAKQTLKKRDRVTWWLRFMRMKICSDIANGLYRPDPKKEVDVREACRSFYHKELARIGWSRPALSVLSANTLRSDVEHWMDLPVPKIQDLIWDRQTPSLLWTQLQDAEAEWKEQTKGTLVPQEGDKPVVDFHNGWAWWLLARGYCDEEAKAMGHCGNVMGKNRPNERILSLRKAIRKGTPERYEPHLTFILDTGDSYLGEMKGRGNEKPAPQYHPYIVSLLESGVVKGIRGGGYLPEHNFKLGDLPDAEQDRLVAMKPKLAGFTYRLHKEGESPRLVNEIGDALLKGEERIPESRYWEPKFHGYLINRWRISEFVEGHGSELAKASVWILQDAKGIRNPLDHNVYDVVKGVLDLCSPETSAIVRAYLFDRYPVEILNRKRRSGHTPPVPKSVSVAQARKLLRQESFFNDDMANFITEDLLNEREALIAAYRHASSQARGEMQEALEWKLSEIATGKPTDSGDILVQEEPGKWDSALVNIFPIKAAAELADEGNTLLEHLEGGVFDEGGFSLDLEGEEEEQWPHFDRKRAEEYVIAFFGKTALPARKRKASGGGPAIGPLAPQDVPEAMEVAKVCFPAHVNDIDRVVREELGDDFSHSYAMKLDGKIIGGYFLGNMQLPEAFPRPETVPYQGKRGIEGIALFLLPQYRNAGWGKRLRAIPLSSGVDYVWGQHYEDLGNLQNWTYFGRRHLFSDVEDGQKYHVTVMDLRPISKEASAIPSFEEFLASKGGPAGLIDSYDIGDEELAGYGGEEGYLKSIRLKHREMVGRLGKFPLTLYREISLDPERGLAALDETSMGISWTSTPIEEGTFWQGGAWAGEAPWIFRAEVGPEAVDWMDTMWHRFYPSIGEQEDEVTLKEGAKVRLLSARKAEDKAWRPFGRTVTAAAPAMAPAGRRVNDFLTQTPAFRAWFRNSVVKYPDGRPRPVYHGSTHSFEQFSMGTSDPENYYGKGMYFTDSQDDVARNYATEEGPDTIDRIDRRVDDLLQELEEELRGKDWQWDGPEYDDLVKDCKEKARKEILGGGAMTYQTYLRIERPVVVSRTGGTHFEISYNERTGKESGSGMRLYRAFLGVADDYGTDGQKIWAGLGEAILDEFTAYKFEEAFRRSEEAMYLLEDHEINSGGFISAVYRKMGFDGIVQMEPDQAFPSMGIYPGTHHYVVWNPRQVKSAIGNAGTFSPYSPRMTAAVGKYGPDLDYGYHTSCVEHGVGEDIQEMVDSSRDVTYNEFKRHCDELREWEEWAGYLPDGSRRGLTLRRDPEVSYHKGTFKGVPCYYMVHSAIEYVWTKKGYDIPEEGIGSARQAGLYGESPYHTVESSPPMGDGHYMQVLSDRNRPGILWFLLMNADDGNTGRLAVSVVSHGPRLRQKYAVEMGIELEPADKGKGWGQRLYDYAIGYLKRTGVKELRLQPDASRSDDGKRALERLRGRYEVVPVQGNTVIPQHGNLNSQADRCPPTGWYSLKLAAKEWDETHSLSVNFNNPLLRSAAEKGSPNTAEGFDEEVDEGVGEEVFYHASRRVNRKSIREKGLIPQIKEYKNIDREPGVYLFADIDKAEDHATYHAEYVNQPMDIWEVRLPENNRSAADESPDYVGWDAFVSYDPVPPENLSLIKTILVPANRERRWGKGVLPPLGTRTASPSEKEWEPWIGVDLDGTLAEELGEFDPLKIGKPIPAMVEKIKRAIARGETVKIFTARLADEKLRDQIKEKIREYTKECIGKELDSTNEKDPGLRAVWDLNVDLGCNPLKK